MTKISKDPKSFPEANSEEWQLGELLAGLAELDSGQEVSHDEVSKRLKAWGKPGGSRIPS